MEIRTWYTRKNWTTDEVATLRLLAGEYCLAEIAAIMGRSDNSIRGASHRFKIKVLTNKPSDKKTALRERIRELYKTKPISEITRITGMSYHQVYRIVTKNPG